MVRHCDVCVLTEIRFRQRRGDRLGKSQTADRNVWIIRRGGRRVSSISHEQGALDLGASAGCRR